jgi:hypothetical protein
MILDTFNGNLSYCCVWLANPTQKPFVPSEQFRGIDPSIAAVAAVATAPAALCALLTAVVIAVASTLVAPWALLARG